MSAKAKSLRITTPRAGLTRAEIMREALRLVDRHGGQSLTMRRLGAALGVEAMSLYHHVRNKDELVDGLAALLLRRVPVAKPTQPWPDAVRAFATGVRKAAAAHPAAFALVGMRPVSADIAVRPAGSLVTRLHEAGFSPEGAVAAFRLVAIFARGFALAEIAGFTLAEASPATVASSALAPFTDALTAGHDSAFENALDIVVSGIAAQLEAAATEPVTEQDEAAGAGKLYGRARAAVASSTGQAALP
jgi:AcrR family transcriptional regulator